MPPPRVAPPTYFDMVSRLLNFDRATRLAKAHPEHVLHFLIVGGGLAGLASAISLCRAGHRATVFEQTDGTLRVRVSPNSQVKIEKNSHFLFT